MAEDRQCGASELLSRSANVAKTIQGAIKAGKAIAGAAKGAAVGGPYGAAAMALWQNRKTVIKIVLAAAFVMLLPILFILMLPSLIFGGLKANSPDIPVMNDNTAIYANIEDVNSRVYEVINSAHEDIIKAINDAIALLPEDSEHEILDDYGTSSLFDTTVLISQYCAYKDNYEEISANDLISMIEPHKEKLFTYTVVSAEREITVTVMKDVIKTVTEYIDSTVTDDQGRVHTVKIAVQKEVTVQEPVEEKKTVTMYTYTVIYAGEEYFSKEIFKLDEEKTASARDYAENLAIFLNDRDDEGVAGNGTHTGIMNLIKDDSTPYNGGDFMAPVKNWHNHVSSEFGERTDPINGSKRFHNGIDIGVLLGTPIYAVADGTVLYTKKQSTGYGHHIVINHGGRITTLYGHCSELLVSDGQTVKKGDVIAKSGSTGRSTGPHLHFEVMVDGVLKNPREYLP
ncbi:MAG: M23 family metallopeptidase [Oscillospiraceae bacterium]|jgi:murein DD-endopeptidase MepM/ murein hydrolase activator NlpD|nr:M23 family metallopeptidase [Oscillospiraceae bacterium]